MCTTVPLFQFLLDMSPYATSVQDPPELEPHCLITRNACCADQWPPQSIKEKYDGPICYRTLEVILEELGSHCPVESWTDCYKVADPKAIYSQVLASEILGQTDFPGQIHETAQGNLRAIEKFAIEVSARKETRPSFWLGVMPSTGRAWSTLCVHWGS
ncbi:hypothetical protein BP00DRAFT_423181 [Aspergillus indologenus CBS 114.80]|uniref:Uncharacterized protein n=1 Tax=Aspergillus indologenus CBS 114.80 TaxID=1450541 RepID=A0A2V5ICD9_9EURO|nr:hypothetical protein BP00DRAFT_423181 [Aspergillus indologenus CBS 114.80]